MIGRFFDDVSSYFFTRSFMLWLVVLNMVDAVLTVFAVGYLGAFELNPLFSSLNLGSGFLFFIFIKLVVSFFLLIAVSRLWNDWWLLNRFVRVCYLFGSAFAFFVMVVVVCSNVGVILTYL